MGHREGMLHGFEHHDVIDIRFHVYVNYVNGCVVYVGFSELDKPDR